MDKQIWFAKKALKKLQAAKELKMSVYLYGATGFGKTSVAEQVFDRTSTIALTNATLRYGLAIANHGLEDACRRDPGLAMGVNTHQGRCTNQNVAESLGVTYSAMF